MRFQVEARMKLPRGLRLPATVQLAVLLSVLSTHVSASFALSNRTTLTPSLTEDDGQVVLPHVRVEHDDTHVQEKQSKVEDSDRLQRPQTHGNRTWNESEEEMNSESMNPRPPEMGGSWSRLAKDGQERGGGMSRRALLESGGGEKGTGVGEGGGMGTNAGTDRKRRRWVGDVKKFISEKKLGEREREERERGSIRTELLKERMSFKDLRFVPLEYFEYVKKGWPADYVKCAGDVCPELTSWRATTTA